MSKSLQESRVQSKLSQLNKLEMLLIGLELPKNPGFLMQTFTNHALTVDPEPTRCSITRIIGWLPLRPVMPAIIICWHIGIIPNPSSTATSSQYLLSPPTAAQISTPASTEPPHHIPLETYMFSLDLTCTPEPLSIPMAIGAMPDTVDYVLLWIVFELVCGNSQHK